MYGYGSRSEYRIYLGFCDSIPYGTKLQLYIPDKNINRVSFANIYSTSHIESITVLFNDFRYDRQLRLDNIKKLPKIDLTPFSEVIIEANTFAGSNITDEDTYILEKATHIGEGAFRDCNLTRIKFNPNLGIIPKNAFRCNKNLEYIELGEKTKVEKDAFAECIKVTSNREDINAQLDEERIIAKELLKQHMRANAMSGGSYNLEVDESSNTLIFLGAIRGRESELDAMQVVRIPMYVTKIGRQGKYGSDGAADLSRCHIEGLIIPDSVESICNLRLPRDIKYVKIGKGVKYIDSDSLSQLFKFCPRVEIPYGIEEIPSNTFYNTGRIVSIKLPTTLKTIGYRAFYSIYSLKMVHIPPNCCIENEAFYECDSLSYVYIYKDCVVKKQAFRKCPNLKYAFVEDGATLTDNAFPRKTKIIWFHKDFNYMHMGDFLNKHIFITEDEKDYISEDVVNTNTYSRIAYRVWSWLSENAEELPEFGTTAKDLKRLLETAEEIITDRKQLQEMCLPPSYTTADEFISRITQYTVIAKEILG